MQNMFRNIIISLGVIFFIIGCSQPSIKKEVVYSSNDKQVTKNNSVFNNTSKIEQIQQSTQKKTNHINTTKNREISKKKKKRKYLINKILWDGKQSKKYGSNYREAIEVYNNDMKKNVTIIDNMMWQDNFAVRIIKKDWSEARKYCNNLKLQGYDDWYLPSKEQLLNFSKKRHFFKNKNLEGSSYWSSAICQRSNRLSWRGLVYDNYIDMRHTYGSIKYYVRCIRYNKK